MNKHTRYSKRLRGESPECGIFSTRCSICLEHKHDDCYSENPYCSHNICDICFNEWTKNRDDCPTCKKSLVFTPFIYTDYGDKLYPPLYSVNFEPPPIWVSNILIFTFKCLNKLIWYNGDSADEYKEEDEDEIMSQLDRLNRLETALE